MTMKVLAATLLASAVSLGAAAQVPAQPAAPATDAVRQAAASDKRGLVEKNMQLGADEAKRFWPVYDEYQRDLDRITQKYNRAVLDYVNGESSMTDANARRIAKDVLQADGEEQRLRERTAKKMLAAVGPRKTVRFLQIENKLRTLNRYDIAQQIPLIR